MKRWCFILAIFMCGCGKEKGLVLESKSEVVSVEAQELAALQERHTQLIKNYQDLLKRLDAYRAIHSAAIQSQIEARTDK